MVWHRIIDLFLRKIDPFQLSTAYATPLAETLTTADRRPEITGRVKHGTHVALLMCFVLYLYSVVGVFFSFRKWSYKPKFRYQNQFGTGRTADAKFRLTKFHKISIRHNTQSKQTTTREQANKQQEMTAKAVD